MNISQVGMTGRIIRPHWQLKKPFMPKKNKPNLPSNPILVTNTLPAIPCPLPQKYLFSNTINIQYSQEFNETHTISTFILNTWSRKYLSWLIDSNHKSKPFFATVQTERMESGSEIDSITEKPFKSLIWTERLSRTPYLGMKILASLWWTDECAIWSRNQSSNEIFSHIDSPDRRTNFIFPSSTLNQNLYNNTKIFFSGIK